MIHDRKNAQSAARPSAGAANPATTGADPLLGVIHHRDKHKSLKRLAEVTDPEILSTCLCDEHITWREALEKTYQQDAHIVTYSLDDGDGGAIYARVSKRSPFVQQFAEAGGRVLVCALFFDFDLPKSPDWQKQIWSEIPGAFDAFRAQLSEEVDAGAIPEPTAFYTTLHGARFVYILTEPTTPYHAEAMMRGFREVYGKAGIELDPACKDWTRLYRLPRTTREDSGEPYEPEVLVLDGPLLNTADAPTAEVSEADKFAEADLYEGDMPDPDECEALRTRVAANGNRAETAWFKLAKKFLTGREAFGPLFDGAPLVLSEQGWNNAVTKMVGQAVGMLARQETATPEGIYALFEPAVAQLQRRENQGANTTDWHKTTWDLICRMWSAEQGQIEAELAEARERAQEAEAQRGEILADLREAKPDLVPEDDEEAIEQLRRAAIVVPPKGGVYVLRADGNYSTTPVSDRQLHATIRAHKMECIIPTTELRGKQTVPRQPRDMYSEQGLAVREVRRVAGIQHPRIARDESGNGDLELPLWPLRGALEPEFSQDAHDWIISWAGIQADEVSNWLASVPEVGRPTSILVIIGPPGFGKTGLLIAGLGELFADSRTSTLDEAMGQFNGALLDRSPIVHGDEGMTEASHGRSVDSLLRALPAGGLGRYEKKGQDVVSADANHRVVLTANNEGALDFLKRRDLSAFDRQAIDERFLVVRVPESAATWLQQRGNWRFTRGWVRGEGRPSQYILARHVLWLHQQRIEHLLSSDSRFLVPGTGGVLDGYEHDNPKTVAFVETVCRLVANQHENFVLVRPDSGDETPGIYLVRKALSQNYGAGILQDRSAPSDAEIEGAGIRAGLLEVPNTGSQKTRRLKLNLPKIHPHRAPKRWCRVVDLPKLREAAQAIGCEHVGALECFMVELGELDAAEVSEQRESGMDRAASNGAASSIFSGMGKAKARGRAE